MLAAIVLLALGSQAGAGPPLQRYIVQLSDPPLASYRGGVPGLAATNPALGAVKLDSTSSASRAYLSYLDQRQNAFAAALAHAVGRTVGVPFTYRYAFDGVAVVLTADEAAAATKLPNVVRVEKEQTLQLETDVGPQWIG